MTDHDAREAVDSAALTAARAIYGNSFDPAVHVGQFDRMRQAARAILASLPAPTPAAGSLRPGYYDRERRYLGKSTPPGKEIGLVSGAIFNEKHELVGWADDEPSIPTATTGEAVAWLDTLRDAFMTSQSNGHPDPSERSYRLIFSFPNMDALHAAHAAMVHAFRKADLCSTGASDASVTGGVATATTDAPQPSPPGGDATPFVRAIAKDRKRFNEGSPTWNAYGFCIAICEQVAALANHSPDAGGVGEKLVATAMLDSLKSENRLGWVEPTVQQAYHMARAAIAAIGNTFRSRELWRHKKRGSVYEVIGEAELQCATHDPSEGDELVIYRGDDGKLWARMRDEFHDGRFAALRPGLRAGEE